MSTPHTFESILELFAKTNEQLKFLSESTDKKIADLIREQAIETVELKKSMKALNEHMGGIANSQGDVTEEYFVNSLGANPVVGKVKYDRVEVQRKIIEAATGKKFEVDILLVNGKAIAIIEVKYRATKDALKQLETTIAAARAAMPEYKKHSIYGGIASFAINDKLKEEALSKGFFVLQRKGGLFESDTSHMRAF